MPTAASAEADSVTVDDDESLFWDTAGPWSFTFPAG